MFGSQTMVGMKRPMLTKIRGCHLDAAPTKSGHLVPSLSLQLFLHSPCPDFPFHCNIRCCLAQPLNEPVTSLLCLKPGRCGNLVTWELSKYKLHQGRSASSLTARLDGMERASLMKLGEQEEVGPWLELGSSFGDLGLVRHF